MTLQDALQDYLEETGCSMRALSLNAGLGETAVSDILRRPGLRPTRSTLMALERATARALADLPVSVGRTYADLIAELRATDGNASDRQKSQRLARRLRWLMRQAGWVPETRPACRREVVDLFETNSPATFGVSKASFATYKSEVLSCLNGTERRGRRRGIADIDGPLKQVHARIRASDLPLYQKNGCGSFFVYLFDHGIEPPEITKETLRHYFEHRLEHSTKSSAKVRRHVKEMATLTTTLATHPDFADYGFIAVPHPFRDGRDRYGISDDAISELMAEFDARIAPWTLGRASNQGEPMRVFLEKLDARSEMPEPGKKALLRRKKTGAQVSQQKRTRGEELLRHGYLPADRRWSETTLRNRRSYVAGCRESTARGQRLLGRKCR